jgi:adenine C2-methylase RlmN of 23S rRNA A2503 and tRNA A37
VIQAEERRRWFAAGLTAAGFTVSVRYSLGADISAACGQLVQLETGASPGYSSAIAHM